MINNRRDGPEESKKNRIPNHGYNINDRIREQEMRVINADGVNLGVVSRAEALAVATSAGLDLVQIGKEPDGVVIAKIMDFGKFLYEKKKQQNEAKKKQKVIEIKEIKLRLGIDVGDYQLKVDKVASFIEEGDHVKITIQFKGREMSMKNSLGAALFERVLGDVREKVPGFIVEYQKEAGMGSSWTKVLVGKKK